MVDGKSGFKTSAGKPKRQRLIGGLGLNECTIVRMTLKGMQ